MRKLKSADVFVALRMIKKASIKEEMRPYFALAAEGKLNVNDLGIETVLGLMEILCEKKAEFAFYEFLAGPFEKTAEEIEDMDLDQFVQQLAQIGKENDLKVFTHAVSGLISTQP